MHDTENHSTNEVIIKEKKSMISILVLDHKLFFFFYIKVVLPPISLLGVPSGILPSRSLTNCL